MHDHLDLSESYRRHGTARRAMTLAPLTPSQDVTRYQAKLMPPPIFDLDRKDEPSSLLAILFRRLAFLLPFRRSSLFRARYGRTVVKE